MVENKGSEAPTLPPHLCPRWPASRLTGTTRLGPLIVRKHVREGFSSVRRTLQTKERHRFQQRSSNRVHTETE